MASALSVQCHRKICSSQQVLPNSLPAMANVDNRVEKVDITGTVDDCFDKLKRQVGPFLLHAYVKRKQAASFKSLVQKCDEECSFAGRFF